MSFLIAFLILFLNILYMVGNSVSGLMQDVKEKLGVHLYIKDSTEQKDVLYQRVMALKNDLEKAELKVDFSSKEDAFRFLQNKMPDIAANLKKYGIENPLPATLYVSFDNNQKYTLLKKIIENYKDVISNSNTVSRGYSFAQQETRVVGLLNISQFVMLFSYGLVAIVAITIALFLIFMVTMIYNYFHHTIEVQKLLGASYSQIKLPYIAYSLSLLLAAYLFYALIISFSISYINYYTLSLVGFDLIAYLGQYKTLIINISIIQIIVLALFTFSIANDQLTKKLKKA
ncbi:MAG TPA: permease-like cell division protein FtsX [Candidatus Absconditabacterales bacterium]|nr:permease-like cell division protein FtsX [Candidatus Absconditabacterales bacterium]HMT27253.1 permease-like cell division protein FtsX [Candidatus Absconditabacterales bacterium]